MFLYNECRFPVLNLKMNLLQCLFTNLIKNILNLNGLRAFINLLVCQIDIPKQWEYLLRSLLRYLLRPYLSVVVVDDSFLQDNTERECLENIEVTVNLLIKLGFEIHGQKSILKLTQELEFLGFVLTRWLFLRIKKSLNILSWRLKNLLSDPSLNMRDLEL